MKILLLGKNGQVGWELQRSLAPLGEVIALDSRSTEYCGDLTNLQGLADTVHAINPAVIVNAAAHTAVDKAESERELARTVNALAPAVLAEAARVAGHGWSTTRRIMSLTAVASIIAKRQMRPAPCRSMVPPSSKARKPCAHRAAST